MNASCMALVFFLMVVNVFGKDICDKFSMNHMKIMECNNVQIHLLKVITLKKDANVESEYIESFRNGLMQGLDRILQVPVILRNFSLAYEEEIYDYTELFSRSGIKFEIRETQKNKTLIYDGQDFANHSYKDQGYVGIIVLVEDLHILDDYLEGSVRPPFQSTEGLYTIFVMATENNSRNILERVLEKLWRNYGILIAVVVFVCQDNVSLFCLHCLLSLFSYIELSVNVVLEFVIYNT